MSSEFYLSIAEVSGVFVAFGAMMSTSRRFSRATVVLLRAVVVAGLVVMVGALTPTGLTMFGLEDSILWRASCAAFLLFELVGVFVGFDKKLLEAAKQQATETEALVSFKEALSCASFYLYSLRSLDSMNHCGRRSSPSRYW